MNVNGNRYLVYKASDSLTIENRIVCKSYSEYEVIILMKLDQWMCVDVMYFICVKNFVYC